MLATLSWCFSHVAAHWSNISGTTATATATARTAASTTRDFRNIVSIVSEYRVQPVFNLGRARIYR